MKRIISSILLGVLLLTLVAVPVLAAYYAYLTVEEEDGNDYEELAVICSRNVTQLVDYDLMTSTGLDSRVLTGDGDPLPHMLSEDKILFVTDLAAYEEKTLIFYLGATSLSSFPIVLGYDGYLTTPDNADLELTYVMELLVAGYFDAATGADKNILYKEDAYRVYISDDDEITVAGLSTGDVEEWTMTYGSFTTGLHTVYVVSNGLAAYLYVDDFVTAKDTENLYETYNLVLNNLSDTDLTPFYRRTFYANGRYWAFYGKNAAEIYFKTSTDGTTWSSESAIGLASGNNYNDFGVWLRDSYFHIAYSEYGDNNLQYRRGIPASNGTVTWSAAWQTITGGSLGFSGAYSLRGAVVAVDTNGYPFILFRHGLYTTTKTYLIKSSANDGTWTTAGGYPLYWGETHPYGHSQTFTAYPDSNKMYVIRDEYNALLGRYYNGSSWSGSDETIDTGVDGYYSLIADASDNVFFVYGDGSAIFLRIRYANGVFSSVMQISASGAFPSVSYNTENDVIYIFYTRSGSVRVRALSLAEGTISTEYTLFAPSGLNTITTTAFGNMIGILYNGTSVVGHGYLSLPWDWNDNNNDWTWMENNVMPYASYLTLGIDGVAVLEYEPDSIISGTTMPDESGSSHPATITWGSNPSGVTTSLAAFVDEDEAGPPFADTIPGLTAPPDMVGPTGQPGWTADIPSLTGHPLYPLVNIISGVTGIPAKLIWILGATLLVAAAMLVCFRYAPHQLITVFVGGGLSAFFYSMEIYPFWVIFIFAVMGIAVIIGERSPTVS